MIIPILCAGDQHRWERPEPKQLVDTFGEPLIIRTMRQLEERGHIGIAITHRREIGRLVPWIKNPHHPKFDRGVNETAAYTKFLWKSPRVVILLGDVCFPNDVLDRILSDKDELSVWGRQGNTEIFAVSFAYKIRKQVIKTALKCVPGRVAQFYRVWCGFHFNTVQYESEIFKNLDYSWVTDFDTVDVYERFVNDNPGGFVRINEV